MKSQPWNMAFHNVRNFVPTEPNERLIIAWNHGLLDNNVWLISPIPINPVRGIGSNPLTVIGSIMTRRVHVFPRKEIVLK